MNISLGVVHLERDCQWLPDLRLAPAGRHPLCRRRGDDRFMFSSRPADVTRLHRRNGGGLLADETGLLIRPDKMKIVKSHHLGLVLALLTLVPAPSGTIHPRRGISNRSRRNRKPTA